MKFLRPLKFLLLLGTLSIYLPSIVDDTYSVVCNDLAEVQIFVSSKRISNSTEYEFSIGNIKRSYLF